MFALSLGVRRISDTLPEPAYAFLSGLNASTVGIIAVAAVQLAEKCIKDPLSRLLVIFGACAGLCYSALWYFPILVFAGGAACAIWDLWLGRKLRKMKQTREDRRARAVDQVGVAEHGPVGSTSAQQGIEHVDGTRLVDLGMPEPAMNAKQSTGLAQRRQPPPGSASSGPTEIIPAPIGQSSFTTQDVQQERPRVPSEPSRMVYGVTVRTGLIVLVAFLVSFTAILVTRSELAQEHRPLSLFANMYLAGTIIFGGGPVVIPLLREYVVSPGWVSPRDFLIGLAIIQAFPGPNFNFAVYLGALAVTGYSTGMHTGYALLGAVLGFVGIFLPGLVFAIFSQGLWRILRNQPLFLALLRGINATAVGLVFTAVYRLWEVGYLTSESTSAGNADAVQGGRVGGRSLADEPWWVVVAVLTYACNKWFGVPAAAGIAAGGVLGLAWWAATQR